MALAASRLSLLYVVLVPLGHAFRLEPRKAQRANAHRSDQTQRSALAVEADSNIYNNSRWLVVGHIRKCVAVGCSGEHQSKS